NCKPPVQHIFCYRPMVARVRRHLELLHSLGTNPVFAPQPLHTLVVPLLPILTKLSIHLRTAIRAAALLVDGLDLPQPPLVLLPPFTPGAAEPPVIARNAHLQNAAHRGNAKLLAMRFDEAVLHLRGVAKEAAAFFRISFSSSSCWIFRRRSAISCSCVVRLPWPREASGPS